MRFLQALVSEGLGPVRASEAPTLYRVLLAALLVSLVLSALRAARSRDLAILGSLVLQVPALYGVWLAYGQGIGLAALALPPLVWSWVTQLPSTGWNVPARLLRLLQGPYSPGERSTDNTPWKRLRHALFDSSAICALITVGITHALPSSYLTMTALFALGIVAEGIFANLLGTRGYVAGLLVTPILLAAGVLGAANVFAGATQNPTLDGIVWIQATAACATYAFIQFLVLWTRRTLASDLSQRSLERWLRNGWAHLWGKRTPDDEERDVVHDLDAASHMQWQGLSNVSHQLSGLSALAFLLAALGIHLLIDDLPALTAAVPTGVPLVGALVTGVALFARRRLPARLLTGIVLFARQSMRSMAKHRLNEPVIAFLKEGGGAPGAAHDVLGRALHSARGALTSAVVLALAGYVAASSLLGFAPLSQENGETLLDFVNGTGTDSLLRTAGDTVHLLANGVFWLQALRALTSVALVLSAVGAVRFVTVVRDARRAHALGAGQPATVTRA